MGHGSATEHCTGVVALGLLDRFEWYILMIEVFFKWYYVIALEHFIQIILRADTISNAQSCTRFQNLTGAINPSWPNILHRSSIVPSSCTHLIHPIILLQMLVGSLTSNFGAFQITRSNFISIPC